MTNISFIINVIGNLLLIAFIGVKLSNLYNLSRKTSAIVVLLSGVLCFLNVGGTPVFYYIRSFAGELSITSIVLLTGAIFSYFVNINSFFKSEIKKTFYVIALTGSLFYTFALGFTYFDPYSFGFHPKTLLIVLFIVFIIMWFLRFYLISICLILSISAYFFKIHNSMNLWDYLLDPWIVFYSIFSLIKPFIPYKWCKKYLQQGTRLISKGFSITMNKIKKLINITNKLPKLLEFILFSSISFLCVFTIMRIIFYKFFGDSVTQIPSPVVLKAFYVGLKFDLRLALMIHIPLLIFAKIKRISLFNAPTGSRFWTNFLIFIFSCLLFVFIADFGYYGYLQTGRIDATSLRFLLNPLISLQMIWESYHVVWFVLLYIAIIFLFRLILIKIYYGILNRKESVFSGKNKIYTYIVYVILFIGGIYGKFSHYPLRWSDAFFSNHYYASVVSLNPVLYFFETLKNREIQFDLEEVKKYHETISEHLGVKTIKPDEYSYIRENSFTSDQTEQPNIMVILLESFAFYKTGISGNPLNPTPNFDKIAREGILFNRFYSPHGGTARSVFTLLTGMPDIEAIKTSSRNPLVVSQHTIVNAFKEHEKYYFIGGSANWGNVRGILQNNIPGLKLYEEGSFSSPRIDVWGICDLHLFEESNLILREEKNPFFAVIHTAGNHKPYTIPKDNRGFKKITPSLKVEDYGFRSVAAYNAFRFMDHSLGVFFEKVKKEKYFDNTIFVLLADHGLLRKADHMSKAENELGLTDFHTPLVIYSPNKIKQGKVVERVASQVDVLPTIASFTKTPYVNSTFGRNLLDTSINDRSYAFTITHYAIHELGLLSNDFYYRANADATKKNLYQLNTNTPTDNVLKKFPDIGSKMEKLCFGIYETARYVRYNNSADDVTKNLKN